MTRDENRRLSHFESDPEPAEPVCRRVAGGEHYGDDLEDDRPVPDDVGPEPDEIECVDCGSPSAVEDPSEEISEKLPSPPRCRACLKELVA